MERVKGPPILTGLRRSSLVSFGQIPFASNWDRKIHLIVSDLTLSPFQTNESQGGGSGRDSQTLSSCVQMSLGRISDLKNSTTYGPRWTVVE